MGKFVLGFAGCILLLMVVLLFFPRGYFISGLGKDVTGLVWAMIVFLFLILGVILISLYWERIRNRHKPRV